MKSMKVGFAILVASASTILSAVEKPKSPSQMTPEERAARRAKIAEMRMKATGGQIDRPGSQKGKIAYVNCADAAKQGVLNAIAAELFKLYRYKVTAEKIDKIPTVGEVAGIQKSISADFAIFVVADKNQPFTVAVYPEQRFAFVNAAVVAGTDQRLRKELLRTFAFLCGSASSQYMGSLLSPVSVPFDIDTIKYDEIPYDALMRMQPYLKGYEVTPLEKTSYKTACAEGWAPSPTNDAQKAIWDQAHQLPDSPLKISAEPKKAK